MGRLWGKRALAVRRRARASKGSEASKLRPRMINHCTSSSSSLIATLSNTPSRRGFKLLSGSSLSDASNDLSLSEVK